MKAEIDAGAADKFVHGVMQIVSLGNREVGVVRWHNRIYVIRNVCPHQPARMSTAVVRARLLGGPRPGTMRVSDHKPVIACPWHHWEFDLATGECIAGGRAHIRTFGVRVERGRVLIDVDDRGRARPVGRESTGDGE